MKIYKMLNFRRRSLAKIEFTSNDLQSIEAALHTHQKILTVRATAGGENARRQLASIEHLIATLNRASYNN